MATPSKGLGRGLDALFQQGPGGEQTTGGMDFQELHIDLLEPNPGQPRKHLPQESLQELSESIKSQGLLQPLLVRPSAENAGKYQIIAGERRWRASRLAGLDHLPVIISEMSDADALVIGLIENLQREDLNPIEEAEGLGRLQELLALSQEGLSQKVGKSRSSIANSLRLLHLEDSIREALRDHSISPGQARCLLAIDDSSARLQLFKLIVDRNLTVRQLEQIAAYWKNQGRLPSWLFVSPAAPKQSAPDPQFQRDRKRIQKEIASRFSARVRIQGDRNQGSISLKYSSQEELDRLLDQLGVSTRE